MNWDGFGEAGSTRSQGKIRVRDQVKGQGSGIIGSQVKRVNTEAPDGI